jgi:hypothetical protein
MVPADATEAPTPQKYAVNRIVHKMYIPDDCSDVDWS